MRLLLLDNYDSFTYNLVQYFKELECDVSIVRNDEITLQQIEAESPDLIVISPGPCSPDEAGICLSAVEYFAGNIPMLGVCLGHQAIVQAFGGKVVRAQKVMHGKVSDVQHRNHDMFAAIPEKFSVTRYHSLVVCAENLPEEFVVTATSCTTGNNMQEIMAIAHTSMPLWGVQFHPESHLTEHGHKLLANIIELSVGAGSQINLA